MKKNIIVILIFALVVLLGLFPCPIYQIFGIPCPTCGITRACKLFLTGHFKEAFLMHPLFFVPCVFLFPQLRKKWVFSAVIVLFIGVYVLRFIALFPIAEPFNYNYNSILGEFLR